MAKTKSDYIHIRVSPAEKNKIKQTAEAAGLDSLSAYLLWLFRTRKGDINDKNS